MIARIWRGVTKAEDAGDYEAYIAMSGFAMKKRRIWSPGGDRARVRTFKASGVIPDDPGHEHISLLSLRGTTIGRGQVHR